MSHLRQVALALAVACTALLLVGSPASAHSGSSVKATNYRSSLTSVAPALEQATLEIIDLGDQLLLTNHGEHEITVLGYEQEPYLRVGPEGVWENRNSPAAYLNQSQDASNKAPASASAAKAPDWKKLTSGNAVSWHDHRIHWMGVNDPPVVRAAPSEPHIVIDHWEVAFLQGDAKLVAVGNLWWVPGTSSTPWIVATFGATLAAVGWLTLGASRRRVVLVVELALLACVAIADAIHVVGVALLAQGTWVMRVSAIASAVLPSALAWLVMVFAAKRLLRADPSATWFVLFGAGLLFLSNGLVNWGELGASQVPTLLPHGVARSCVAVVASGGGALVTVSVWRLWSARPSRRLVGGSTETENQSRL